MPHARESQRRRVTVWIPVVVSALVQSSASAWLVRVFQPDAVVAVATFALAAVGPVVLIGARRWPGPVVAIAAAAAVLQIVVGVGGGPPPVALAFAVVAAVVRGARIWAWASLGAAWLLAFVVVLNAPAAAWTPPRIVGTTLGLLLLLGVGEVIRGRRERQRALEEELAQRRATAAEEERLRIARELHDVLAHSLSQINVQAGVGLHLAASQPETAVHALASIKEASKQALDDVRGVLGLLRDGGGAPRAPQPGLSEVASLVDAIRIPGVDVVLDDRTAGVEVPSAIGAAVYRIVQEALTNVARHGNDVRAVTVTLDAADGSLRVSVADDGAVTSVVPGRGLAGMQERVAQLDGSIDWTTADGFTVSAEIPWRAEP